MPNSQDIYAVTISGLGNSNHTFEIDTKTFLDIPGDGKISDVPIIAYCIGNPIAINLFLQMGDMADFGLAFPADKNTNLPYAIMLTVIDNVEVGMIFLGDATQYSPSDPDKIITSIKHTKQSTIYPIDGKFLTNAQSD